MKTLSFKVSENVKNRFIAAFQNSGESNQSKFFESLFPESESQPKTEKKDEPKPAKEKRFQFLAIIDGSIQRPVFDGADPKEATKKFRKQWPKSTIHECKEI